MNIQTVYPTTPDEFLRWNEGREGKREFVNGRIVEMMVGVSKYHFIIASRLTFQLTRQLGQKDYVVGAAEFGVKTASGARYPDVLVDRVDGAPSDLSAREPLLVAEVLSPSSYSRDFGEKVHDYSTVPSMRHYLILSQDEPRTWLWSRDSNGAWGGPDSVAGMLEIMRLPGLDIAIDLAEIYDGLFRPESH